MVCEFAATEKSEENFEKSVSTLKTAENRKELGVTYLEYGRMLKKKGDKEKGKAKLTEALRIFKEIKMQFRIDAVEKDLEGL